MYTVYTQQPYPSVEPHSKIDLFDVLKNIAGKVWVLVLFEGVSHLSYPQYAFGFLYHEDSLHGRFFDLAPNMLSSFVARYRLQD